MKKIFLISIIVLIANLTVSDIYAESKQSVGSSAGEFIKVGGAGSQFLKIGPGARASGMAGAYGAVTNDLTAVFWNPAGLADVKGISGDFSWTSWFGGFSHNFAAVSIPVGSNFTMAASFTSFSSNDIEITTIERPEGTGFYYQVNDVAAGATFSGYLTDQFSFGITAKYISNSFSSLNAYGVAFDVGTMYETGIQGIKLGFSIHNLGTTMQYTGQELNTSKKLYTAMNAAPLDASYTASSYSIPLIFRAGISSNVYKVEDHSVIAAVDFVTMSDTPEQFALGGEYTWRNFVMVRAGYRFGHDQFGFSGGLGLKYIGGGFSGQVDYSLNPTKNLGLVNRITVSLGMK